MNAQFAKFLASGAVAAALNFGSRIIFSQWMPFIPAVVLAFIVGMITAFVLNRTLVFSASGKHWSNEAAWFVAINLLGMGQTVLVSWLLSRHVLPALGVTRFVEEIAHAVGIVIPIITSFIGHKHLTFKRIDP